MEFKEYPKWLPIGDGVIVWSKEEEDGLRKEETPKEVTPKEVTEKKRGRPRKVVNDGNQ